MPISISPNYEIVLLIDGLPPIQDKVYQTRIKTNNKLQSGGNINLFKENGLILLKDLNINEIEHIIISRESSIVILNLLTQKQSQLK